MSRSVPTVEGYISTNNRELDNAFGGGLVIPSLVLVEGNNDAGKSVIVQQFLYGAMLAGLDATVLTTESTTRSFLSQMKMLHLDLDRAFIEGKLRIIPIHVKNIVWTQHRLSKLLNTLTGFIETNKSRVFLIDSMTYMFAEAGLTDILTFFSRLKKLTEPSLPGIAHSKTVIGTLHSNFHGEESEELLVRIRALCDAHIKLSKDVAGGQVVRRIEVCKLKGSQMMANKINSFEIHPAFGVRIVPTSEALA
ncbi:MAG TPA: ATPase domain-containing protein [Candidatus Acidoferrales bacterium]|nr:ATPase domain-containing protein [Candidatus Acidoferrales bacterium]